jgi:predicted  nucleic acid-binding Zn-ribbon protein
MIDYKSYIEKVVSCLEEDYNCKIQALKKDIDVIAKDNKSKNNKINDLNEKIGFYESETKALTNDVILLSTAIKDIYFSVEGLITAIESDSFDIEELDENEKKKVFH